MVKKARSDGEELDKFIMQGSAVDNNLSKINISPDSQPIETGMGVMTDLLNEAIDGQTAMVPVKTRDIKGNKGKSVYTFVSFSYDEEDSDLKISLGQSRNKLTPYDKRTINAIGTLFLAGKDKFSLTELFSVANGYANKRPNKKQLEALERSIRKIGKIRMTLDVSAELAANNFQDKQALVDAGIIKDVDDNIKTAKFEGRLMPVEVAEIESEKGLRSVTIRVLGEPLLLTYNRAKRTLMAVPMEYLRNQNISMSERSIAIQDYLLKRVIGYQKGYFNSNKIMYDTILTATNLVEPAEGEKGEYDEKAASKKRMQKKRDRDLIFNIFDSWVKGGLIDSFSEIVTGAKTYKGIEFVALTKLPDTIDRPMIPEKPDKDDKKK
ncbi:MAG: hypothetical protein IKT20_01020 [Clostridiales bacterium]|nr:hypothetical protein [Clostridiales bacterium]